MSNPIDPDTGHPVDVPPETPKVDEPVTLDEDVTPDEDVTNKQ